jgi:hypothetical protein
MATTKTTTDAKLVKLWARVEAATVNSETGEVVHTPGVDPKYLTAELVKEIQGLSQQLDAEKAKVADLTAKLEAATKATTKVTHTFGESPSTTLTYFTAELQWALNKIDYESAAVALTNCVKLIFAEQIKPLQYKEVTHAPGVDPEYLAAELVKEIQRQQPASSV